MSSSERGDLARSLVDVKGEIKRLARFMLQEKERERSDEHSRTRANFKTSERDQRFDMIEICVKRINHQERVLARLVNIVPYILSMTKVIRGEAFRRPFLQTLDLSKHIIIHLPHTMNR